MTHISGSASKSLRIGIILTFQNLMSEKLEEKEPSTSQPAIVDNSTPKRRGRPPGAKNKLKLDKPAVDQTVVDSTPKRRGRPPGAKNKLKQEVAPLPTPVSVPCVVVKKPDTNTQFVPTPSADIMLMDHPLLLAARWVEKNMHPAEMNYYRSRASKNGLSIAHSIVADLIGFFNIQDSDITKQIKKNNFVASISKTNGLH